MPALTDEVKQFLIAEKKAVLQHWCPLRERTKYYYWDIIEDDDWKVGVGACLGLAAIWWMEQDN